MNYMIIRSSSSWNSGHYYVGYNLHRQILEERSTKDAECIQSLESQLFQKKQQLKDLIEKQDKRTPSSTVSEVILFVLTQRQTSIYTTYVDIPVTYLNCI